MEDEGARLTPTSCGRRRFMMALPLEQYALLGDCQTAVLVGRNGSMDWLCLPRFDSDPCFSALLGDENAGRWLIAPRTSVRRIERRYLPHTLILATRFFTDEGVVELIDFMPPRTREADVVRIVRGISGRLSMALELILRFDFGKFVPWIRSGDKGCEAIAGPDRMVFVAPLPIRIEQDVVRAEFEIGPGEEISFLLSWTATSDLLPEMPDPRLLFDATHQFWTQWCSQARIEGPYQELIERSLITLKAMTHAATGGIVAAVTTSLPEEVGGCRNWDYRYCWIRDSSFTLKALLAAGFRKEAEDWYAWLLRAVAVRASQMQIVYGVAGERSLTEREIPWLSGYEGSRPVRIGNHASSQRQNDVFGEIMDFLHAARAFGIPAGEQEIQLQLQLMEFVESRWDDPDRGIWETRNEDKHFTYAKVMSWVAVDRAVKAVEAGALPGPVDDWRRLREHIADEVRRAHFDPELGSFVQARGEKRIDASLLRLPLVGFISASDPLMVGTVKAIERELTRDGFVHRYRAGPDTDGLPGSEGSFLLCSFWLADVYLLQGRQDEARALFERLLGVASELGLLSEEYDVARARLVGNFPQAFSHVALVNTALSLSRASERELIRSGEEDAPPDRRD